MRLPIIVTGKNTLFGNPQASRKNCKVKAVVSLQGIPKQISDEAHHLIIVASLERFI